MSLQDTIKEHPEYLILGAGGLLVVVILASSGKSQGSTTQYTPTVVDSGKDISQPPGQGYVSSEMLTNALDDQYRRIIDYWQRQYGYQPLPSGGGSPRGGPGAPGGSGGSSGGGGTPGGGGEPGGN